jgi:hypothetical protein
LQVADSWVGTALIGLLSVVLSCTQSLATGERKKSTPRIDKAKYEAMSIDLYRLQTTRRFTIRDTEEYYKAHGVTKGEYEDAIGRYGRADSVKAEELKAVDPGAYDLWFFRRGPGHPPPPSTRSPRPR